MSSLKEQILEIPQSATYLEEFPYEAFASMCGREGDVDSGRVLKGVQVPSTLAKQVIHPIHIEFSAVAVLSRR